MTLCAQCGVSTELSDGLCAHHGDMHGGEWATSNRIVCDFIHRGIEPPPVTLDAVEADHAIAWA